MLVTADLVTITTSVRQFLEPCWLLAHESWEDGIPTPLSCWMCRYSSLFLSAVLAEQYGLPCQIVAGRPQLSMNASEGSDAGILSRDDIWNDHCWVESHGFILDVTADQFGYDPVIISDVCDHRYRANLSEQDIAPALAKLSRRSLAWLAIWKQEAKA